MKGIKMFSALFLFGIFSISGFARVDLSDGFINIKLNHDTTQQLQNEQQVVINPLNKDNIVAVWRDFRKGYRQVGYGWTKDGGITWHDNLFVETYYPYDSDPGLTVDSNGNFYASVLGFTTTSDPNALYVYKSINGGESWTGPYTVVNAVPGDFEDKELIACDRSGSVYDGNLYVTWARFGATTNIFCSRSTNGGVSFESPVRLSDRSSVQWPVPVVGPVGELYIAWDYAGFPSQIKLDRSYDGGITFGSDITVKNVSVFPGSYINGDITVFPYPAMDIDMNNGNLYMAYMDDGQSSTDIFFTKSTDQGQSWSASKVINDDLPGNGCDQFHPWLSVDEKGFVAVVFMDRRNDPANYLMDCYMTWSLDQGATFSKNIRLTNVSSDPQAGSALFVPGYRAGLLGEYIGLSTRSGKRAAPVWVDTRNGNQDTYFALPDSTRFSVQFTTPTPSVPRGGMLTANYVVTNNGSRRLDAQAWVNVYLKNGSEYPGNPYKGPVPAPIAPGQQKSGSLEFKVPQNAPVGKGYRLELCTGYYPYFVLGSQNFEFEITGS